MEDNKLNQTDNNLNINVNHETNVINVAVSNIKPQYKNLHEWISNSKENYYIGRGRVVFINGTRYPLYDSIWANPFKITEEQPREKVIELYKDYIEEKIKNNKILIKELLKLKGKKLGCWCKPECCHGDVLVELIKKYDKINDT
jgi:hypothetical protein